MWYVFEPAAVLPEYLVTFRYTVSAGSPLAAVAAASSDGSLLSSISPAVSSIDGASNSSMQNDPLLKLCAKPLQPWLAAVAQGQQQQHGNSLAAGFCQQPGAAELEQRCRLLLEAAVAAAPKQQLAALTPTAMSAFLGGQQVGCSAASTITLHALFISSL
jgi:hypothetical protein